MIWVTRDYVHVDRVACPWLIKRFVDIKAQFIFLPKDKIDEFVEKTGAILFDSGGGELDHYEKDGEKFCTFDAIIEKYNLQEDKALEKLRLIVRAADTGKMESHPLSYALEAIASGAPLLVNDDHEALELEFPFYDSIYAYLKREIILEKYESKISKLETRGERRAFIKDKLDKI